MKQKKLMQIRVIRFRDTDYWDVQWRTCRWWFWNSAGIFGNLTHATEAAVQLNKAQPYQTF